MMTVLVIILLTTVFAIELFLRLPFSTALKEFTAISRKALRVMRSRSISEHWKEVVLPRYSIVMLKSSLKLLAYLLVIIGFVSLADIFCRPLGISLTGALSTWSGVSTSMLAAGVYLFVRKRLAA